MLPFHCLASFLVLSVALPTIVSTLLESRSTSNGISDTAEALYLSGMELHAKSDFAGSLDQLRQSCDLTNYTRLQYVVNYAVILSYDGQYGKAIAAIKEGISFNERESVRVAADSEAIAVLQGDYKSYSDYMMIFLRDVSAVQH